MLGVIGPSGKRLGLHVVETNAKPLIEVLRAIRAAAGVRSGCPPYLDLGSRLLLLRPTILRVARRPHHTAYRHGSRVTRSNTVHTFSATTFAPAAVG
jgi:hypothetical protein